MALRAHTTPPGGARRARERRWRVPVAGRRAAAVWTAVVAAGSWLGVAAPAIVAGQAASAARKSVPQSRRARRDIGITSLGPVGGGKTDRIIRDIGHSNSSTLAVWREP